MDNIFAYNVALNIMKDSEDLEPRFVEEYGQRSYWPKGQEAIQSELNALAKREVFELVVQTPAGIKLVSHKGVFVRKRNDKNKIERYKARHVAQEFSQRHGVNFDETYSVVMDAITFGYLISLALHEKLEIHLMDVVTAYLHGSLANEIYMKIPEGFKMSEKNSKSRDMYSIRLQISLYGLKGFGHMWYNRLSEYLLKAGYTNDVICLCI